MRFLITFSYDGNNYFGYQSQPRKKTIQSEMEKALKQINDNKKVVFQASGRTDAKVHALNQKGHCDLNIKIKPFKLVQALNSLLPADIHIKEAIEVSNNFHARFDSVGKEYQYILNMGEYNPINRNYIYQYNKKLDVVEMQRAIKYFEGKHDFKSFTKADLILDDYHKTITYTSVKRDLKDVDLITFEFVGDGFLKYMIRNIVGLLIEIGEGKRKSEEVIDIIENKDRTKAGLCAPPEGLYLKNVFY